jgi:ubiquinone biosynthesis accessory factor UbiJ
MLHQNIPPGCGGKLSLPTYNAVMIEAITSGLSSAATARLILLANHVLSSEPVAVQKLQPFTGRNITIKVTSTASQTPFLRTLAAWLPERVQLQITPAGLLELVEGLDASPDSPQGLSISVDVPPPWSALQLLVKRERPPVTIEGDAALAEAASWLLKNLRWDLEDDLARWLGTTPSQVLSGLGSQVKQAFARWRPGSSAR